MPLACVKVERTDSLEFIPSIPASSGGGDRGGRKTSASSQPITWQSRQRQYEKMVNGGSRPAGTEQIFIYTCILQIVSMAAKLSSPKYFDSS